MSTQSLVSRLSTRDTRLASVFPRGFGRGASWPNPEQSIGRFIVQVGKELIWEAKGEAQEAFKNMAPDIKTHLDHCIEPLTSWVTWSMYMMGRSPSTSSPTIIFCCEVAEHRRKIRDVVKNSGILERYTGIKTGHMPCLPAFDQLIPLTKGIDATDRITSIGFEWPPLLSSGITPAMPLTIRRDSETETSFSKATIGGIICIGEKRFYTTAAHAIVAPPKSDNGITHYEDGDYQSDDDTFSFDGSEEWCSTTDVSSSEACEDKPEEKQCDEHRPLKASHPQSLPSPLWSNAPKQPQRAANYEFDYEREVFVAQQNGPGASLDYALIEVPENDPRNVNVIRQGQIGAQKPLTIGRVALLPSQDVAVVLITCRGNFAGRMAATPIYGLAPGGNRFQKILSATFEAKLEKGDCGSWVIDSHSGDLYGHLVAGSLISGGALLVPFIDIFGDIRIRDRSMPHLPVAHFSEPALKPSGGTNSSGKEPWQPESPAEDNTDTVSAKGKEAQRHATETTDSSDLGRPPCAGLTEDRIIKNWAKSMTTQFKIIMRAKHVNEARSLRPRSNQGEESSQVHSSSASIQALRDRMSTHSQAAGHQREYSNFSESAGSDRYQQVYGSDSAKTTVVHSPGMTTRTDDSCHQLDNDRQDAIEGPKETQIAISVLNSVILPAPPTELKSMQFRNHLVTISKIPLEWEKTDLLGEALDVIPLDMIHREAQEESQWFITEAASFSDDQKPEWDYDDCTVRALLRWFKRSFFKWIKNPACPVCSNATTRSGIASPTDRERRHGAERVELYQCSRSVCRAFERIPRYSDPLKLLQTRRGRIGEWTNCSGLMCRAVGARVRWVWTAENHVWIEVYSKHQQRWVHVDAFEEAWDNPHLYTDSLGKRLSCVIAFSADGAADVTRRYAKSMYKARPLFHCSEPTLLFILQEIRTLRRAKLSPKERSRLEQEDAKEAWELRDYNVAGIVGTVSKLWLRRPSSPADPLFVEADAVQDAETLQTDDNYATDTGFLSETLPWETQSRG